jgi:hypothetical protein
MDFINTLLASAAVSAALTGALFWLLQNWISERLKNAIKHEYDVRLESYKAETQARLNTDLESHKAKLQAENVAATERLKSDLQIAAAERQVRFSKLHEKVAESVAEMWLRLKKLKTAVRLYTSPVETPAMGSKSDRRVAMADAMKAFQDYYYEKSLYLPRELDNQIKEFDIRLHKLAADFMYGVEQGRDELYENKDTWANVSLAMEEEAEPLFAALEAEFRRLLGVE